MDRFTSFNCNYRLYHKELNKKQPKKKKKHTHTKHDYLVSTATKHCTAFIDSSITFFVNCSHV